MNNEKPAKFKNLPEFIINAKEEYEPKRPWVVLEHMRLWYALADNYVDLIKKETDDEVVMELVRLRNAAMNEAADCFRRADARAFYESAESNRSNLECYQRQENERDRY